MNTKFINAKNKKNNCKKKEFEVIYRIYNDKYIKNYIFVNYFYY